MAGPWSTGSARNNWTLGRWRRGAEETLILFLIAIMQLRFESRVLFQEFIDPLLLLQASFANRVRSHAYSWPEVETTGGAASHRYRRASRRRG